MRMTQAVTILATIIAMISGVAASMDAGAAEPSMNLTKIYYQNNDLHQTYSYKMVPAGLNETEFNIAFEAATPVFAGEIEGDLRKSLPLQAYNLATDEAGNSA